MKIVGIVSEYNPLHYGHMRQMKAIREQMGADTGIICIMSGNFVQRGDFAIYDKWARSQAAVKCGADIVLELPLPYVLSSAEYFARGAVSLLNSTGVVTDLSFGSEAGDIEKLASIAKVLNADTGEIKASLKGGASYAAACQALVIRELGARYGEIIASPNNILGVEYIRSIYSISSNIKPGTILRTGAGHDSIAPDGEYVSAAYIRELIRSGSPVDGLMPDAAADLFAQQTRQGRRPVFMGDVQQGLLALLRSMDKADFSEIADNSEGIENRLRQAAAVQGSIRGIIDTVKTKRYPESRIRRMLLSACIGIKRGDRRDTPPYIRILASGSKGRGIIRDMTKKSSLPVITKPSKIKSLSQEGQRMFALESRATDLYVLAYDDEMCRRAGREWRQGPFIAEAEGEQL